MYQAQTAIDNVVNVDDELARDLTAPWLAAKPFAPAGAGRARLVAENELLLYDDSVVFRGARQLTQAQPNA